MENLDCHALKSLAMSGGLWLPWSGLAETMDEYQWVGGCLAACTGEDADNVRFWALWGYLICKRNSCSTLCTTDLSYIDLLSHLTPYLLLTDLLY